MSRLQKLGTTLYVNLSGFVKALINLLLSSKKTTNKTDKQEIFYSVELCFHTDEKGQPYNKYDTNVIFCSKSNADATWVFDVVDEYVTKHGARYTVVLRKIEGI